MKRLKLLNIHKALFVSVLFGLLTFVTVLILTELYPNNGVIRRISSPELLIAVAVAFPTIITWYFSIKSNTVQNLLETVKHYDQEINDLIKDVQESNKLTIVHISKMEYIMDSFENIIKDNYKKGAITLNYEGLLSVVYAAQPNIDFSKLYKKEKYDNDEKNRTLSENKEIDKDLSKSDNDWMESSSKIVPRIIRKLSENHKMESLEDNYYKVFAKSKFDIMKNTEIKKPDVNVLSFKLKNKEFWECEFSMNFLKAVKINDCNFYSCIINFEDIAYEKTTYNQELEKEIYKENKENFKKLEKALENYFISEDKDNYNVFESETIEIEKNLSCENQKVNDEFKKIIQYFKKNIKILNKLIIDNNFRNSIQFKTNSFTISLSNLVKKPLTRDEDNELLGNDLKNHKDISVFYDDKDNINIKSYMYREDTIDIKKTDEIGSLSTILKKKFILESLNDKVFLKEVNPGNCVIKISKPWSREGFNWLGSYSIIWKPYEDIENIKFYIFAIEMENDFKCIIFERDKFKRLMEEKKGINESQIDFKFNFGKKRVFD